MATLPEYDLTTAGQENDRFNEVLDVLAALQVETGIWANGPITSLPWDVLHDAVGHAVGRALAKELLTGDDAFLTALYDRAVASAMARVVATTGPVQR